MKRAAATSQYLPRLHYSSGFYRGSTTTTTTTTSSSSCRRSVRAATLPHFRRLETIVEEDRQYAESEFPIETAYSYTMRRVPYLPPPPPPPTTPTITTSSPSSPFSPLPTTTTTTCGLQKNIDDVRRNVEELEKRLLLLNNMCYNASSR
ncbi:unnamed protein product [Caenorhabditis bovis]|uniref:Uncharacterized protein n=1 Tax=Caenorhabditis bovis TaxID=2654633 RepID=A0A8S1EFK5_9PELO|nr:unnamed protein product [Caenorhabditis bovis]